METSGAREEINSGPQEEGETRTITLMVDKPEDHLNCQASLGNVISRENIVTVPYVAGRLVDHYL